MNAPIVAKDQRVNQIPLELETAKENARRFRLSPFTIRRLGYAGVIKEFRCGRAVRYSPEEIFRWMESQGRGQRQHHDNRDRRRPVPAAIKWGEYKV